MAIFSTFTSLLVALVPETHGPTLLKQKLKKAASNDEGAAVPKVSFGKILRVYQQALKRPIVFFCTGESSGALVRGESLMRYRDFIEPIVLFVSIYLSILYGIL